MPIATPVPAPDASPPGVAVDERLTMYNVPWTAYEAQLALRGEKAVPRITYLDGVMELMSPSRDHERIKSYLGRLVETYALERGLDLSPYGSWTLRQAPKASGLEPDECYIIGADQSPDQPHLAIEVVWTHGGIDKLEIYRRLEIAEVWVWRNGALQVYVLRNGSYTPSEHSEQLPGIDLAQLASFLDHPSATQAMRAYRAALQK